MEGAGHYTSKDVGHAAAAAAATVPPPGKTVTSANVIQLERPKASTDDVNGLIPAWLALVGVIVTIIGKWIADKFQRQYELRRQLYLELIDATFATNACLGKLCDAAIPLSETTKSFQDASPAIAKAEVTAPKNLSRALTRYKDAAGEAFMKLMAMRVEVERLKAASAQADIGIAQFEAERRVFMEERRRMTIEGVDDSARADRVQKHYELFSTELNALYEKKRQHAASMQEQVTKMGSVAVDEMKVLARLAPPVLKHVRRGLGFWSFDVRDYSQRVEGTVGMVDKAFKGIKDSVENTERDDKG